MVFQRMEEEEEETRNPVSLRSPRCPGSVTPARPVWTLSHVYDTPPVSIFVSVM